MRLTRAVERTSVRVTAPASRRLRPAGAAPLTPVAHLLSVRRCYPPLVNEAAPIQKLLFVCSQNKLRSLTAEKLFEGFPAYQVRSVGTQPDARIAITEGHIGW